jgi:hypothetical protein
MMFRGMAMRSSCPRCGEAATGVGIVTRLTGIGDGTGQQASTAHFKAWEAWRAWQSIERVGLHRVSMLHGGFAYHG